MLRHVTAGDVLRGLRKAAGMTQQQLADAAKIDRSVVNQIERGKRGIGPKNAARLAAVFKVSPDDLMSAPARSTERLEALEAEVSDLRAALDVAGRAHDHLRRRVLALGLEPAKALQPRVKDVTGRECACPCSHPPSLSAYLRAAAIPDLDHRKAALAH